MYTAEGGYKEIVQMLLGQKGIDVRAQAAVRMMQNITSDLNQLS